MAAKLTVTRMADDVQTFTEVGIFSDLDINALTIMFGSIRSSFRSQILAFEDYNENELHLDRRALVKLLIEISAIQKELAEKLFSELRSIEFDNIPKHLILTQAYTVDVVSRFYNIVYQCVITDAPLDISGVPAPDGVLDTPNFCQNWPVSIKDQ